MASIRELEKASLKDGSKEDIPICLSQSTTRFGLASEMQASRMPRSAARFSRSASIDPLPTITSRRLGVKFRFAYKSVHQRGSEIFRAATTTRCNQSQARPPAGLPVLPHPDE